MFNFRKVKTERSGWRNEDLSRRHREWGFDCPITDIDFLVIEYDKAEPIALVEYKREEAKVDLKQPNYQALKTLADRASIPFFVIIYKEDFSRWRILAGNERASKWDMRSFSEQEFVDFLYKLRGRELPLNIRAKLKGNKPTHGQSS